MFLCFLVALAIHVGGALSCGCLLPSKVLIAGSADGLEDRVFVTVVAAEDFFAHARETGEVDSPESRDAQPSQEQEKPEEVKPPIEQIPEEESPEESRPPVLAKSEQSQADFVQSEESTPESVTPPMPVAKEKTEEEESATSIPQVASAPTRLRSALGNDLHDFQAKIVARIREATFFPKQALTERRHGEVIVKFTITRDGVLYDVSMSRTSGSSVLDEAALDIVKKASEKFPPIPPFVQKERITYTVPILFKESRAMLR
jgi:protein TonB